MTYLYFPVHAAPAIIVLLKNNLHPLGADLDPMAALRRHMLLPNWQITGKKEHTLKGQAWGHIGLCGLRGNMWWCRVKRK
jgi:hypothetical protein